MNGYCYEPEMNISKQGVFITFSFPPKYKVQKSPFAYSQNGKKEFVFSQSTGHKDLVQALIPEIVPKKLN